MSAEIKKKIKSIVSELQETMIAHSKTDEYSFIEPKANPPATELQIKSFEKFVGHKLPPSFKAFLELFNGYKWLSFSTDMLPIEDLLPGGESHADIQKWKNDCGRFGATEVLDGIVIGNVGGLNKWVYLDPKKPGPGGEFTVVEWEPEDSKEFPTFIEFLEECLEGAKQSDSDLEDDD